MKIIKLILFSTLLFFSFNIKAQDEIDFSQELYITKKVQSFESLVSEILLKGNVKISYSSAVVQPRSMIRLSSNSYQLRVLLDEICDQLKIEYVLLNGKILFVERQHQWQEYWIHGFVRDKDSREALIGAVVYNHNDNSETIANDFGYFSIKVQSPNPYILVSYLGYENVIIQGDNSSIELVNILMMPIFTIEQIVVVPFDSMRRNLLLEDVFESTMNNINPGVLGEKDAMQAIKYLPGIQSGSELQGNILVRGGGSDQNLIMLDGVPLYEVNHLLGLSSIFNEDAVNNVDVITSGFSSKFGGRLSSIINVQIKDGNKFVHKRSTSIGLLGARFHADGPIVKGKTSYNISARTSYINFLVKPLASRYLDLNDTDFAYQDLNLKFHHQLTKSNSLSLSSYFGKDKIGFNNESYASNDSNELFFTSNNEINWSNAVINLRFNQIINKKLFFNISVSNMQYHLNSRSSNVYFGFDSLGNVEKEELDVFTFSLINDTNLSTDWEYRESNLHLLTFGAGYTSHRYNPSVISRGIVLDNSTPNPKVGISADQWFLYLEDEYEISEYVSLSTGFHLSSFLVEKEQFNSFQPRVKLVFQVDEINNVELSYSKMTQFVHLLVNPGTGLPSDLWVPSTSKIPPEHSIQYNIKYSQIWNTKITTFISAYYKEYENLVVYRSAFPLYNPIINKITSIPIFNESRDYEDRVEIGEGNSYGVDIFATLQTKRSQTSFSYGYGVSNRLFEKINRGKKFPFKYDRRHDISLRTSYKKNEHWSFGSSWIFGSGYATTIATSSFLSVEGDLILDFSQRNNFRLPAYHRLDLNVNYNVTLTSKMNLKATFGVYNTYNRLNPYYVYVVEDSENKVFNAKQVGLFPVLPFLNIGIKF